MIVWMSLVPSAHSRKLTGSDGRRNASVKGKGASLDKSWQTNESLAMFPEILPGISPPRAGFLLPAEATAPICRRNALALRKAKQGCGRGATVACASRVRLSWVTPILDVFCACTLRKCVPPTCTSKEPCPCWAASSGLGVLRVLWHASYAGKQPTLRPQTNTKDAIEQTSQPKLGLPGT